MTLHSSTIAAMACAFALLLAISFHSLARIVAEASIAKRFAIGNILFAAGSICQIVANDTHSLSALYCVWLLLPAGLAIQYSALRHMSGRPNINRQLCIGFAVHALALAIPPLLWRHEQWMGIPTLVTTFTLLFLLSRAYDALRGDHLRALRSMMRMTYMGIAVFALLQAATRVANAGHEPNSDAIAISQFGFSLLFVVMNLGYIITFILAQQQVIGQLSNADPVTSVLNRHGMELALAKIFAQGKKRVTGTVLLINIDRFKSINDNLGHSNGDAVLRDLGIALRARMRKGDLLARTGGKEFCILLQGTHVAAAQVIAERLRIELADRKISAGEYDHVSITVSIGLAEFDLDKPLLDAVLQRADIALHAAKGNGRNRTETWSSQLEMLVCSNRYRSHAGSPMPAMAIRQKASSDEPAVGLSA